MTEQWVPFTGRDVTRVQLVECARGGCRQCAVLQDGIESLTELFRAGQGVGGRLLDEYVIAIGHLDRVHGAGLAGVYLTDAA